MCEYSLTDGRIWEVLKWPSGDALVVELSNHPMLLLTETGIVVSDGGEKDRTNLFRYNRSELNENEPMKKPRKGKLMRKVRGYVCM